MPRTLPMFPLPVVLFPGVQQPLHVFEPRYRQLLEDCVAGEQRFGIVYAAADPAHPERDPLPAPGVVGCVALIQVARPLPDGRSNILVEGERRFVLHDWVASDRLYRTAVVEEFDDEPGDEPELESLAHDVRGQLGPVLAALGSWSSAPPHELPADPMLLSFVAAASLELDVDAKLALLGLRDTAARLQQLAAALRPLLRTARRRGAAREQARRNGRGSATGLQT